MSDKNQERMRLDKLLANMGIGSRKDSKKLCKENRVTVNGEVIRDSGCIVNPELDRIEVDKVPVRYRKYIYLIMNKPQGVISATEDYAAETVIDLLTDEDRVFSPFPVGRLDKDTEGLLLLTNDGQFTHQLLAPKNHVPKTYYAKINGQVTERDIEAFANGVILEDGYHTLPGQLKILAAGSESEILLTIYEGKFHQVKRMFEAVQKKVVFLKRLSMGALQLDESLQPGEYRELTADEVKSLQDSETKDARIYR